MNIIWLVLILFIFLLAYLGQKEKRYSVVYRVFLAILLAYITGFGGVGAEDHAAYARMYNEVYTYFHDLGEYTLSSLFRSGYAIESGYILLNVLCHSIGLGEAGFFFVVALFVNGAAVHHIYKHSLPVLSIMALLFISAFMSQQANLVRQFLALGVLMCFIDYLADRKNWWKYLLGVLLAAQFHTSAFFFLIILPISFIKSTRAKMYLRITLVSLIVISILIGIGLVSFNFLSIFDFITAYESRFTSANTVASNMNIIPALIVTLPALYILFDSRLYNKNIIFITFISMTAIFANFGFAYPNLRRMYWYFEPLAYIYLVQYLDLNLYAAGDKRFYASMVRYAVIAFGVYMILKSYIFNPNQLLMSTTYTFNQFFN